MCELGDIMDCCIIAVPWLVYMIWLNACLFCFDTTACNNNGTLSKCLTCKWWMALSCVLRFCLCSSVPAHRGVWCASGIWGSALAVMVLLWRTALWPARASVMRAHSRRVQGHTSRSQLFWSTHLYVSHNWITIKHRLPFREITEV